MQVCIENELIKKNSLPNVLLGVFCKIIFNYFISFIVFSWSLKWYHSFPWNQQTPFGYAADILFQLDFAMSYYYSNGVVVVLFVSMCLHHRGFFKIIQNSLRKLDHLDKSRNDAAFLTNLIQFHNSTKE